MEDRIHIYQPIVQFIGLIIRSSPISIDAFTKQNKQRSGIWKQSMSSVFHIIRLCFLFQNFTLQMSHVFLGNFAKIFTLRFSTLGNLTNHSFRLAFGHIFWYVILEASWYLHNIILFVKYFKKQIKGLSDINEIDI